MPAKRKDASALLEGLAPYLEAVREDPDCLGNSMLLGGAYGILEGLCQGDQAKAKLLAARLILQTSVQRDQLLAAIRAVKDRKPTLAWVMSTPFEAPDTAGRARQFAYVMPAARDPSIPQPYQIVPQTGDEGDGGEAGPGVPEWDGRIDAVPLLAVVDHEARVILRPADQIPAPPFSAEVLQAVSATAGARSPELGEVEVTDGAQRKFTLPACLKLAREIDAKLKEGESITVRNEGGVAADICRSTEMAPEPWLEFVPLEGPGLDELVFPPTLQEQWRRDVRSLVKGRGLRVVCIGPTGLGKTEGVKRAGREAARQLALEGKCKGFALITISPSTVGSIYIHDTPIKIRQALQRAINLRKKGYLVVVLCDEADALFGEMSSGAEHSHNKEERLAFQDIFTKEVEGVAVYLTMNPRRTSWLPAAFLTRFSNRVYPRSFRSQIAAVAAQYVADKTLYVLGMGRKEFGGVFADNLFSDGRVVGAAHFISGRKMTIRARDLHTASPGKVEGMLKVFNEDVADGETDSIESLWGAIDREFQAHLNVQNIWDLTFIQPPTDDSLRVVELGRGATPSRVGAKAAIAV